MRLRTQSALEDKLELNMTPMIDVVFQLLTFFLFTLKTSEPEGNFGIRMPLASAAPQFKAASELPKTLAMQANADGSLKAIIFQNTTYAIKTSRPARPMRDATDTARDAYQRALALHRAEVNAAFDAIQDRVVAWVGKTGAPGSTEHAVEFDCPPNLHYDYVIDAISAVTGRLSPDGEKIEPLIERVRFKP